jgi:hypothetical protein
MTDMTPLIQGRLFINEGLSLNVAIEAEFRVSLSFGS